MEDGKQRYKLLLTETDEQTLLAIVDQAPLPTPSSLRLRDNFWLLQETGEVTGRGPRFRFARGLEKLMVVDIALSGEQGQSAIDLREYELDWT